MATDGNGNVYIAGYTDGSLGDPFQGWGDAWVVKYDAAGHRLWIRQLGTKTFDDALGVATDSAGNVYLTGYTQGSLGGPNHGSAESADAWVAKYDAAGHPLWKRQLGTDMLDQARGVATDGDGNVYIPGVTGGSLGKSQGEFDAFVAKHSPRR